MIPAGIANVFRCFHVESLQHKYTRQCRLKVPFTLTNCQICTCFLNSSLCPTRQNLHPTLSPMQNGFDLDFPRNQSFPTITAHLLYGDFVGFNSHKAANSLISTQPEQGTPIYTILAGTVHFSDYIVPHQRLQNQSFLNIHSCDSKVLSTPSNC